MSDAAQLIKAAAWQALDAAADAHVAAKAGNGDKHAAAQRLSDAAKAWTEASKPPRTTPSGDGAPTVFPPYGRAKGQPIHGATKNDLEFYANGCRRSLGDPSKSRWHAKEQQLLEVIEAELGNGEAF